MASMTKISSNAMRMANTCIVYNNDHTRTEKIVQLHEKDIIGKQKKWKIQRRKRHWQWQLSRQWQAQWRRQRQIRRRQKTKKGKDIYLPRVWGGWLQWQRHWHTQRQSQTQLQRQRQKDKWPPICLVYEMTGLRLVLVVLFRHHPRTQLGLIKIIVVNVNVFIIVIVIIIFIFIRLILPTAWTWMCSYLVNEPVVVEVPPRAKLAQY